MLLAFRTKLVSTLAGVVGLDFGGTTLQDSPLNHMGAEVDWLNSNAGAITGLAAIATARATGVLALITFRYIHLTRDLVKATTIEAGATREQAEASRRQAEASRDVIAEMQRDRELSVRPHFTREIVTTTISGSAAPDEVQIGNFGRGPGINCIVVEITPDGEYLSSDFFDLSGNEAAKIPARRRNRASPTQEIVGDDHSANRIHALFCQDQFGTSYRFTRRSRPPDSWRSDTNVGDQRPALGRLVSAPSRDRLSTTAPETNRSAYIEEYHNDLLSAVEGFLADHFG
jgi:hypothetical protein